MGRGRTSGVAPWGMLAVGVCRGILIAAMAVFAVLALWIARGTTLFVDEINLFTGYRGIDVEALLAPLNGHFALLQRGLFAAVFKLFGASFTVLQVVEVAGVVLVVALFFEFVQSRIGPGAALAPALLLLFFGSAWELNFVVSGIGNVYAVAAGLGALLALERPGRRHDLLACGLLVVAVCSFTLGVAFALGVLVLLVLQPGARRRVWVALVPLALYAAWFVWVRAVYVPEYGEIQNFKLENLLLIPNFIANVAASLAGALAGLNYDFSDDDPFEAFNTQSQYGPLLAALAVVALGYRLYRGSRPPLLYALIAALLAFWIALAFGFGLGRNPTVVRYTYGGAVLALLIAAEAARGVRLAPTGLIVLYVVVALALAGNLARLWDGADYFRSFATKLRAQLTALELARDSVDPSFLPPEGPARFDVVRAGSYLEAVDRVGSPAYGPEELARRPETERREADATSVAALKIRISPAPAGERAAGCRRLPDGARAGFPVPPPGLRITATSVAELALRRFASSATIPLGTLPAGRPVDLLIPRDRARRTWRAIVSPAGTTLTVCRLP